MKNFKKITAKILAASILLTMMMGIASCSARKATSEDYYNEPVKNQNIARETYAADDSFGYDEMADGDYENAAEDVSVDSEVSGNKGGQVISNSSQKLIRKVTMTAETTNFISVTNDVKLKVSELGGYMESSQINGTGTNRNLRTAYFIIRIPADKMDELINQVSGGITIISSNENTTDVTLQYSDMESHIKALKIEQQNLLDLLEKTENLDNMIILQQRLTEISYEIENYQSSLKVLENQVTYSTLTLSIDEVLEEQEVVETKKLTFWEEAWEGLSESLTDVKEDFRDFAIGFISILPQLIIFALFVLIIVLIIKGIIKSSKKKAAAKKANKVAAQVPSTPAPAPKAEEKKTEE